ncbi:MAG: apolipoprotein N-acyltransferase [Reinekea sp.]|jgi:apolipoprotein N-acyltransferase
MQSSKWLALVALLSGLCIPLALAPFNFWPLIFVGVVGFFWLSFRAASARQALWLGWLFGVSQYGLGVSWIYSSMQTVDTPIWLGVLLTSGFCLALALLPLFQLWFFQRFLRRLPLALMLIAPLWWVVNEWVREWLFTGMPWLFAGYALSDTPMAQNAALFGVYGLSLMVAVISAGMLRVGYRLQRQQRRSAQITALSVVGLLGLSTLVGLIQPASDWTEATGTLKVAAIQSNVDQRRKWTSAQQQPTLDFYSQVLRDLPDIDLMLWPEAAMTLRPEQIPTYMADLQRLGTERDMALLTGVVTQDAGRYYNAILGYGMASGEYRKQHLVPFGEYLPLEKYLRGTIAFFDLPTSVMYPAAQPQRPIRAELNGQPYFIAPVICYEATYPDLVRRLARDSDLIAVISNDAWFGDSIAPHQHLQITRMRAIENGRDLLRATQNGVSALIDADGRVLQHSEQFVAAKLTGELTLRTGLTPFQRLPSAFIPWLCLSLLIVLYLMARRKNRPLAADKPSSL